MSKISIDLRSSSGTGFPGADQLRLSSKEAISIFRACTLIMEKLEKVAEMVEVITVRLYNTRGSRRESLLFFRVKVVLVEPGKFHNKFEVEIEVCNHDHTPTAEEIVDIVFPQVLAAIEEQASETRQNHSRMTQMLKTATD